MSGANTEPAQLSNAQVRDALAIVNVQTISQINAYPEPFISQQLALTSLHQKIRLWRYRILTTPDNVLLLKRQGNVLGVLYYLAHDDVQLMAFYLHPDRQRQGLGSQMFNTWLTKLKNLRGKRLKLFVLSSNLPAIAFYRQIGFDFSGASRNVQLGEVQLEMIRKV